MSVSEKPAAEGFGRKEEPVRLRAHHGMCLAYFRGEGYSDGFTAHMGSVRKRLMEDSSAAVEIVAETDEICKACPNNEGGVCRTADKVRRYDTAVLEMIMADDGNNFRNSRRAEAENGRAGGRAEAEKSRTEETAEGLTMRYAVFARMVENRILQTGKRSMICGDCQWNELCR